MTPQRSRRPAQRDRRVLFHSLWLGAGIYKSPDLRSTRNRRCALYEVVAAAHPRDAHSGRRDLARLIAGRHFSSLCSYRARGISSRRLSALVGHTLREHRLEHQRVEISTHLHNSIFGSSADNAAILRWEPDPQFQDTMRILAAVLSPTHEQGNVGRGIRVFNYAEGIDRSLNRSASFSRRPSLRMCCYHVAGSES